MSDIASSNATPRCRICEHAIERRSTGRHRKFCSRACQQEAFRSRVSRYETAAKGSIADSPCSTSFITKSVSENNGLHRPKIDLRKAGLCWLKVNDVTWKLTDGKMSRTPASYGQWGGYETERTLAWRSKSDGLLVGQPGTHDVATDRTARQTSTSPDKRRQPSRTGDHFPTVKWPPRSTVPSI